MAGKGKSGKGKKASKSSVSSEGRTRRRKETFASYIYKILKQVHKEVGISTRGMDVMNSFVTDIFERIALEAAALARQNGKATITSREIQTAVCLVIPGELARHAVSEGAKAVDKFSNQ